MRAARFHHFGPPTVIRVEDVAPPTPGPGEVLVRVRVAGLNFADTERRRGLYLREAPLPDTLGFEASGLVAALGEGVPASWLDRRVAVLAPRACAELVAAPVSALIPLPDSLDDSAGAAFPVQGLSAWHLLFTAAKVRPGEVVGITAAAGGVGLFATQLARRAGATVIGIVSTPQKAERATAAGASRCVLLDGSLEASLLDATSGRGLDVLLDSVGASMAELAPRVLAPFGRWVCFGDASGPRPPLDLDALLPKSLSVMAWWLRTPHSKDVWERGLQEVLAALTRGAVTLSLTEWRGLEALADAHHALESRATVGKQLVRLF